MPLFNAANVDAQHIIAKITNRLEAFQSALAEIDKEYQWLIQIPDGDLTGAPVSMDPDTLTGLKTALNDAYAHVQLYNQGTLPATITLPYKTGLSQRRVIGG